MMSRNTVGALSKILNPQGGVEGLLQNMNLPEEGGGVIGRTLREARDKLQAQRQAGEEAVRSSVTFTPKMEELMSLFEKGAAVDPRINNYGLYQLLKAGKQQELAGSQTGEEGVLAGRAGVSSLATPEMADRLAKMGRYDDDQIAHVAEGEMLVPAPILKYYPDVREEIFDVIRKEGMDPQEFIVGGDMVARNPYTGVQEFGFLSKVFKGIKKIVKKAAPIILGLTAAALTGGLVNPFTAGSLSGGISALGGSLATALSTTGGALTAGLVGGTTYGLARGKSLKDSLKRGVKTAAVAGAAQGLGAFDSFAAGAPGAGQGSVVASGSPEIAGTAGGANVASAPQMSVRPEVSPQMSVRPEVVSQSVAPSAQRVAELEAIKTGTQLASAPATFGQQLLGGIKSLNPFGGETGLFSGLSPTARTFATTATALTVLPILMPQEIEQYQQESGIALTQEDIDALTGKGQGGQPSQAALDFAEFYRSRQNYQGAGGQQLGGSGIPTLMEGGEVAGPGTGTSDSIPALLSDGEFVMTAKAVRNAGGGNRRKGAAKMYKLMKNLEAA